MRWGLRDPGRLKLGSTSWLMKKMMGSRKVISKQEAMSKWLMSSY